LLEAQYGLKHYDLLEVSKETKLSVSAGRKGIPAHNKGIGKSVMTPRGIFLSIQAVADDLGVTYGRVYWLLKKQPKEYYIIKVD
jgi:hypothetical protein